MNERMHELYAAACLYARDKQLDRKSEDKNVPEFVECMAEKFAELIVRECVLISRTSTDGFSAGRRMEEHFGVEE